MKFWDIKIIDTGEELRACWDSTEYYRERYNPPGGQNTQHPERDEAVGALFAWLADMSDEQLLKED